MARTQTPEDVRTHRLRSKYGITHQQFLDILESQGNCCEICRSPGSDVRFVVDHCHQYEQETGHIKIRGVLCSACNSLLGFAADSPEILRNAAQYLETPKVWI